MQQNIYYSRSRSGLVWNTFKVDKRSKFGNYRNNTPLLLYILYRVDMLCTQIRDAWVYNLAVLNVYVSYCCLLWVWNSLASLLWHQQDIFCPENCRSLNVFYKCAYHSCPLQGWGFDTSSVKVSLVQNICHFTCCFCVGLYSSQTHLLLFFLFQNSSFLAIENHVAG